MNNDQRRVYLLSLGLIGWVAVGGAVFQALMDLSYANACYFCIVSFFTLGFGDIVAKTTAPRIVIIPFIYIGILLIAVSVVSLYNLLHNRQMRAGLVHQIRQRRVKAYERVLAEDGFNDRDCFDAVRLMMQRVRLRNAIFNSLLMLAWLLVFWLLGALVYHYCEDGWTYFESFYFVSIVMATVGYGDFTPQTPGGRTFFVVWAFFAIPTMTSSISYLTDFADGFLDVTLKKLKIKSVQKRTTLITLMEVFQSELFENCEHELSKEVLEGMVIAMIHSDRNSTYPYEMWHYVLIKLLGTLPRGFWLSEDSPLVRPINERKCLLLLTLHCLGMKGARSELVLESVLSSSSVVVPDLDHDGSSERSLSFSNDLSPASTMLSSYSPTHPIKLSRAADLSQ